MSDSLRLHGLQHARLPCPSSAPGVCSNSYPLSQWCHPTISSSVVPFSSCLPSFSASGSLPMSQLFTSSGQSIRASASGLPKNIQALLPLGLPDSISLQSRGLSRVFYNHSSKASTLQCSAFFMVQLTSIHDYWKNHSFDIQTFVSKVMSLLFETLSRFVNGEGDGTPLQYSCLENPKGRGTW